MLVPTRIFAAPLVTADELHQLPEDNATDYQTSALAALLGRPRLLGDVVSNWLRIAPGKRTFVFAVNKAHGQSLMEEFSRAGVAAELLTDADDEATRDAAIARLESGQTQVVLNCFLLSYGIDVPSVECVVLARPTRSLAMYLQMVGRGLRPAPGKEHCVLIDHGRVVESLGMPDAEIDWSLDDQRNVNREAEHRTGSSQTERPRTCPECSHMWLVSAHGSACQQCGWAPAPQARAIAVDDIDLIELNRHESTHSEAHVRQFFQEALGYRVQRKPDAWRQKPNSVRAASWYATTERFDLGSKGVPRRYWILQPLPPSRETTGWMKHRAIKWAKSRQSREHAAQL